MGVVTAKNPEDVLAAVRRLHLKGIDTLTLVGLIVAQRAVGDVSPAISPTEVKLRRLVGDAAAGLARGRAVSRRLDFARGRII
jgi:hypothetical protein